MREIRKLSVFTMILSILFISLPVTSMMTRTAMGAVSSPASYNLALNKTVTATSSVENNNWGRAKLVDGQTNSIPGSLGWSSDSSLTTNHTESITLDLGTSYNIGKVNLFPRNDSGQVGQGFPIDFAIMVSNDNVTWTQVVAKTGYAIPGNNVQLFMFKATMARYVKITGTNLRQNPYDNNLYRMQFAELEVYADCGNLALNKTVTATSSVENSDWGKSKLVDGQTSSIPGSLGWSSSNSLTTNHTESVTVDLGKSSNIGQVNLFPRNDSGQVGQGFPIDFTIMVSNDNVTWTTVVAKTGYAIPGNNVQIFTFSATLTRYVKITGTNLRQNPYDNNLYRMQFAELEVYADYSNLALNKTVTATSSAENSDWGIAKLVDGQTSSIPGSLGWSSSGSLTVNHTESITVDLGTSYNMGKVNLFPRNDSGQVGQGFPIDFTIKVSNDNVTWTTVVAKTGYAIPGNNVQIFLFNGTIARYVKVEGTNLRQNPSDGNLYRMQLAELEVYAENFADYTNLALNKTATASSSVENSDWGSTKVINGQTNSILGSMGWTSGSNLTVNHTESITVDLGTSCNIGKVKLFPRNDFGQVGQSFPIDFNIKVSNDNVTWTTAVSKAAYPMPDNRAQSFNFNTVSSRYVKVEGTNLRQNPSDGNLYRMQLTEVEVYVGGIDEITSVKFMDEPSNIMDVSNAGFDVTMNITGPQTFDYTIEYLLNGQTYTDKMTVAPGIDTVKQIRFTNPPKGAFNLQVNIKNGDRIVKTEARKMAIVEYYQPQFMDSYSREVMATHYSASSNASDQTDIDLMKKAGVVVIRDAIYWGTVEPQKGVWDFSKTDQYMKWLNDAGLKTYIILGFSNTNYVTPAPGVTDPSKCPPRTKAELDAFCEYVRQILTRYQNIVAIEVWNEPNWTPFWQPTPNVIDYATMIKAVSLTVRQTRPDVQIMAGSLVYINGLDYFSDLFGENLFPYIDGISTHPYYFPQKVDDLLPNRLQTSMDIFDSFGGFKDNYASEVGLPTSTNLSGIDEQGQAEAMVKTYVYDDSRGLMATTWYDFRNDGTDTNNNEHNFGVTNKDYTPKCALAALAQRNNRLNGSVYQGEVNIGTGLQAHLYTKDGSPVLVAWNLNAGTAAVNITNSRVEDMYGNVLAQSGVVNLDSSPKYIFGVPLNYYAKAVSYTANKAYDKFLNKWGSIYTNQTALMELKNTAMSLTDLPLSADALNLVQKNYNIETDIINLAKNKSINVTDQQLMSMLNDLNRAGIQWANLYAAAVGNEKITVTINSDALNAATQKVNAKISVENFASMYISQEILRHASRYNQRANEINLMAENPGKGQAVAFNNIMSQMLSGWVSQITDFEKVNLNTGVLLYSDPSNITIYQGQTGQVNLTVDNRKRTDLTNVTAVVKDENGQEVFTSSLLNVLKSGSTSTVLNIPVPGTKPSGQYKYSITIKDNSGEITMESIFVVVQM